MADKRRDLVCGLLFVAVGLFFVVNAWLTLPIGRAFSMGPGYFPVVLGTVLVAIGLGVALSGGDREKLAFPPVPWRGLLLVLGAVLFFAATIRGLGIVPALLVASFMAARATGRIGLRGALLLSLVLTAFNVAIFVFALRLPYPLIGPWLGA